MSKSKETAIRVLLSVGVATISLSLFQNCAEDIDMGEYNSSSDGLEFGHPCGITQAEINACLAAANKAPRILQLPVSVSIRAGAALNLSITAGGDGLTYEWYKDGTRMVQFATSSYSLAVAKLSDAGVYTVIVKNGVGQDTGTITVAVSCAGSAHPQGNTCESNTRSCAIANGSGTQSWNGSNFGKCTLASCNTGFKVRGNTCVAATGRWKALPFGSAAVCDTTIIIGRGVLPTVGTACTLLGHVTCMTVLGGMISKVKCQ